MRDWRRDKSACDAADCSTNEQFTMQAGDDSCANHGCTQRTVHLPDCEVENRYLFRASLTIMVVGTTPEDERDYGVEGGE
jgi:hypothetical protein